MDLKKIFCKVRLKRFVYDRFVPLYISGYSLGAETLNEVYGSKPILFSFEDAFKLYGDNPKYEIIIIVESKSDLPF